MLNGNDANEEEEEEEKMYVVESRLGLGMEKELKRHTVRRQG